VTLIKPSVDDGLGQGRN